MGEKGGLPGWKSSFGVKGSGRVWIETGTPGGGHTLLLQECVQCWVALGPCTAGTESTAVASLVARAR